MDSRRRSARRTRWERLAAIALTVGTVILLDALVGAYRIVSDPLAAASRRCQRPGETSEARYVACLERELLRSPFAIVSGELLVAGGSLTVSIGALGLRVLGAGRSIPERKGQGRSNAGPPSAWQLLL